MRPLKADLSGLTALVTGASSGLGLHFASVIAENGARTILAARRQAEIAEHSAKLAQHGFSVSSHQLDVSSPDSVDQLFHEEPNIDIVINNAGIALPGAALDQPLTDVDRMIDVNVKGIMNVSRAAAQALIARGAAGSIVNIASILGLRQAGNVTGYAVTKAAVIQLTKQYALEWARYGIAVNAIAPGYFDTPLNTEFLATSAGQALQRRIPQRRFGQTSALDGALLLCASCAGGFLTGAIIPVDGGHLASTL
jgi:NAD(P)-dependent dehydrogenase (short-subunit alcohol dehydrogenase family)